MTTTKAKTTPTGTRHGKTCGSGRVGFGSVNQVMGQTGCRSKMGHFKRVKNGFESIGLRVGSS